MSQLFSTHALAARVQLPTHAHDQRAVIPAAGLVHRLAGHSEAPQLSLLQQERISSLRERAAVQFDSEDEAHQVRARLRDGSSCCVCAVKTLCLVLCCDNEVCLLFLPTHAGGAAAAVAGSVPR